MEPSNPIDLPVTQSLAPLAPYPQGMPMGAPLEDEASGGRFSIMGLMHSLRRQLLPALVAGLCLASLLAVLLWFVIPVTYSAEAYLRVNRELFRGTAGDFMIYKETQGSLLKSTFVVSRALRNNDISQLSMVKYDNFGRPRKRAAAWLSNAVKVQIDEDELLGVTMKGRSLKQTEDILKAVIEAYQQEIVNKERLEKVEELANLRKRYQSVYEDIVKETEQVKALAERLGAVDSELIQRKQAMKMAELEAAQHEMERLSRGLGEATVKLNMLKTEAQLGGTAPTQNQILDELERDPRYFEVINTITQYKDQIELISQTARPDNPIIQEYQQQVAFYERKRQKMIKEMSPRISERIRQASGWSATDVQRSLQLQVTLISNLKAQLANISSVFEQRKEELKAFGGTSGELQARRNVLIALNRTLGNVEEAKAELEIDLEGRDRVQIIQTPLVSKPSTLIPKLIQICGGWAISFMGIVGAIAYWDYLSQKVNGSGDIGKSIRVIGTLPGVQGFRGDIEESMKIASDSLRTAILYSPDVPAQCVMVTSATGQEGRSTVASQLAVSMARAGKTTLLIDGDLRNPQQHTIFSVQPQCGLGDMLRGEQSSDQAIIPTSVENVWLLSAGRCDQNALRGLSGDQAKAVFEDFRARFDMIIIDGSPVLTSPDSILLGQNADAAVLSVRRDFSKVPKVVEASDRLASVGIPVIGTVVNGETVELRDGATAIAAPPQEEKPALTNA